MLLGVDIGCFLPVPHCFLQGDVLPPCMWSVGLAIKQATATSGHMTNGSISQVGPIKILEKGLTEVSGERASLPLSSCTLVNTNGLVPSLVPHAGSCLRKKSQLRREDQRGHPSGNTGLPGSSRT